MDRIDLNADVGESDVPLASDQAILACVSSANVACGFHAGTPAVMAATVERAAALGVAIGAHVSYRDRPGFGRRPMTVGRSRLVADVAQQISELTLVADRHGATVYYVKAHGALYHAMNTDEEVTGAVLEAMTRAGRGLGLLAQAGSPVLAVAGRAGVSTVPEAFPDRGYASPTTLMDRSRAGAVIDDPDAVAARAVELVRTGGLRAVDGSWLPIDARSLCVHGDGPRAAEVAATTRRALERAGITVVAVFGDGTGGGTGSGSESGPARSGPGTSSEHGARP